MSGVIEGILIVGGGLAVAWLVIAFIWLIVCFIVTRRVKKLAPKVLAEATDTFNELAENLDAEFLSDLPDLPKVDFHFTSKRED